MIADPNRIEVISGKIAALEGRREELLKQNSANLETIRLINENIWSFERERWHIENAQPQAATC